MPEEGWEGGETACDDGGCDFGGSMVAFVMMVVDGNGSENLRPQELGKPVIGLVLRIQGFNANHQSNNAGDAATIRGLGLLFRAIDRTMDLQ